MIELPLDVYLLNLQITQDTIETYEVAVGRGKQTQRRKVHGVAETINSGQTEQTVRASIARANEIWKPAGIKFQLNKWISKDIEFDSKVVTEEGFLLLVAALKLEPTGLSMLSVRKFESAHLGGRLSIRWVRESWRLSPIRPRETSWLMSSDTCSGSPI